MKSWGTRDAELTAGEEAARWLCELQEADEGRQAEFFAWLQRSPRHVEEFLFATAIWKKLHRFGHENPERVERLIAAAEAMDNVVQINAAPSPLLSNRRRGIGLAASFAAALVVAGSAVLWFVSARAPIYTTAAGEQRIVRLDDGSRVDLNTRSRIAVRFTEHGRYIRLIDGEALFTVAKDPARPFRVEVDGTLIQALGTQFNVYRQIKGIRVSVLEGAVRIASGAAPAQLTAGEEAQVTPGKTIAKRKTQDIAAAVAWRERRLIFRADRLEDVVAEVNRYTQRPLRIADDAARNRRLTAIFDADDPEALVRFLNEMNGISVQVGEDEIVVRSR